MFLLKKINNKIAVLVAVLYVFLSMQLVTLFGFDDGGIKLYHVAILVFFLFSFMRLTLTKNMFPIYCYLLFVLSISLFGYAFFKFNIIFFNYLFCLLLCVSVSSYFRDSSYFDVIKGLQLSAFLVLLLTTVNIILNFDSVKQVQSVDVSTGARPTLDFMLYGGGVNLEATWIALAGAFFINGKKRFLFYVLLSFLIDYFFISRSGFIATTIILIFWLKRNVSIDKKSFIFLGGSVFVLFITAILFMGSIIDSSIMQRFLHIGSEPGSLGRIVMWQYVFNSFSLNPFWGVGAGNSIYAITLNGFLGTENNIHNYFLHNLLEFGVIGFLLWVFVCFFVFSIKEKPELTLYFFVFLILSLIQFRGAEVILYFVISVLVASRRKLNVIGNI